MNYYSRPDDITNVPRQLTKPEVEYYVTLHDRNSNYGNAFLLGTGGLMALIASSASINPDSYLSLGFLSIVASAALTVGGWKLDRHCKSLEDKLPK